MKTYPAEAQKAVDEAQEPAAVGLQRLVRRRQFVCCFCGNPRPTRWRKHGWGGVWVQIKGQKPHWCCSKCKADGWEVNEHARAVADKMCKCEPPNEKLTDAAVSDAEKHK
jgi:hypothetical protein